MTRTRRQTAETQTQPRSSHILQGVGLRPDRRALIIDPAFGGSDNLVSLHAYEQLAIDFLIETVARAELAPNVPPDVVVLNVTNMSDGEARQEVMDILGRYRSIPFAVIRYETEEVKGQDYFEKVEELCKGLPVLSVGSSHLGGGSSKYISITEAALTAIELWINDNKYSSVRVEDFGVDGSSKQRLMATRHSTDRFLASLGITSTRARLRVLKQIMPVIDAALEAARETTARTPTAAPAPAAPRSVFQNLPEALARPYSKQPVPDEVLTPENVSTAYRIQNAVKRRKPEAKLIDEADKYMAGRIVRAHLAHG